MRPIVKGILRRIRHYKRLDPASNMAELSQLFDDNVWPGKRGDEPWIYSNLITLTASFK